MGLELTEEHFRTVLAPRGVTQRVADGGRYLSYTPDDLEELMRRFPFGSHQAKSSRVRAVKSGPGMVIVREGWSRPEWLAGTLIELPQPASQLRPDERLPERRYVDLAGPAKAIDIHPRALTEMKKRDTLSKYPSFFCLEGTMKADAALSIGWQAMDVTSVTTWESPDCWRRIGPKLKDSPILFVVTDSDWSVNPSVWNQAVRCVEWLRDNFGIRAVHVAPRHDQRCKTGLDDAIASKTWAPLTDILVVPRLPEYAPTTLSESARTLFTWLLAWRRSTVWAYPAVIARETGLSRGQVRHATEDLELEDLVHVDHGLRYLDENERWGANANVYRITCPEPVPLSEIGWEAEEDLEPLPPGRRLTKGIKGHLASLGERTLSAGATPNAPRLCEWCSAPLRGKRRDAKFCDKRCRVGAHRGQRPPDRPNERERVPGCVRCERYAPDHAHIFAWPA
jgi:hypothetical protein